MKYAWIAKNKAAWPVTMTCEVLGVSTSGYFDLKLGGPMGKTLTGSVKSTGT